MKNPSINISPIELKIQGFSQLNQLSSISTEVSKDIKESFQLQVVFLISLSQIGVIEGVNEQVLDKFELKIEGTEDSGDKYKKGGGSAR